MSIDFTLAGILGKFLTPEVAKNLKDGFGSLKDMVTGKALQDFLQPLKELGVSVDLLSVPFQQLLAQINVGTLPSTIQAMHDLIKAINSPETQESIGRVISELNRFMEMLQYFTEAGILERVLGGTLAWFERIMAVTEAIMNQILALQKEEELRRRQAEGEDLSPTFGQYERPSGGFQQEEGFD